MKNITMIGDLTAYINANEYKLEIDEKLSNVLSLEELEDLEYPSNNFFELESASKQENKIFLVYNIPKDFKPLQAAKKYDRVIKLQMIKNLLDNDPLGECGGKSYLDLNNIFFKGFNEIKLMYRSNGNTPYSKESILDQYKLFIFGFYSDQFSYKRFAVNKDELLVKEDNEFMFSINHSVTFAELKSCVEKELEDEQIRTYNQIQKSTKKKKNSWMMKLMVGGASVLVLFLLMFVIVKQTESSVASEYEQEAKNAELQKELSMALSSGDTDKAINLMKRQNSSQHEIAKMLLDAGKYDEAISYDSSIEEEVIEKLYKLKDTKRILKLKSNSPFMAVEKDIVRFNVDDLSTQATLIENKNSLKRLGIAFLEHNEYDLARDLFDRMANGDDSDMLNLSAKDKKEASYYSSIAKLKIEIDELNQSILAIKDKYKNDSEKLKNNPEIEKLEDSLMDKQKSLVQYEEKTGQQK
ncbi:hypothetical protein ACO0DA_12120 [Bacillus subtilis]|uniref:hypothetical protein n=1 Tax=Bacillus subtilis TaxID=1423 RepID=UPI00100A22EE|nr:hypothetical protein [Bacillus subtilis]MEC0400814.1 hypothetical protein [Bacillus subtilis]QAW06615.1 hypothetical protein ES968_21870 [Bacillus subtilis]